MSAADMRAGFYGKMPATGDFVARGLPAGFVRAWDRWVARHLVPMIAGGSWPMGQALFVLLGPNFLGPMAGVIMPSRDRVGRHFPLTIAAPITAADTAIIVACADWFLAIERAAAAACSGELTPDDLEAALAALPVRGGETGGEAINRMALWTAHSEIFDVDPDAPQPALPFLSAQRVEVG
jgi:type VI secretion system protein ImpM